MSSHNFPPSIIKQIRFDGTRAVNLNKLEPDSHKGAKHRDDAESDLAAMHTKLNTFQEMLYAQSAQSLLVVLQAMDTGGKDGLIRHVFGPLNPQGVRVTCFKKPTLEEQSHGYLWRIHK